MSINSLMFICVACTVVGTYAIMQKKYDLMNVSIVVMFFAVLGMIIKVFG